MAEVVRYVDPDASGDGDGTSWTDAYTSLQSWEAGEQTDLVTDGDWHHVYCRSSSGTADTDILVLSGWTTDADHYIHIEAANGDEALKTGIDTSRYRLQNSRTWGQTINCSDDVGNVIFEGLQLLNTGESGTTRAFFLDPPDGGEITIRNCYLVGSGADHDARGIEADFASDESRTANIENCVIRDFGGKGVLLSVTFTTNIWHCVFEGCESGIYVVNGTNFEAVNCALLNNTDDVNVAGGSITVDHCASDDGDGTNSVSPSDSDWDNEFSDPADGDFTLLNTGNLYQGGTTITGGPDTDIDGDDWDSSTPSIGVDEYVSAGGTTAPTAVLSGPFGGPLVGCF